MVKKRKVILMTRLAVYEKSEAGRISKAAKYFRGDYISWNVIRSILAITFVYLLCAAMWFIYNSEMIIENVASIDYFSIIRYAVLIYVIMLLSYALIAYAVYSIKYSKAVKSLERYEKGLRQVAKICVDERYGVADIEAEDDMDTTEEQAGKERLE